MILFKYYYGLFIVFNAQHLLAHQCYDCEEMTFNYSITIDNIPPPTSSDCKIITADYGCSVRVAWFSDGNSEVRYTIDPELPFDSVVARTHRQVTVWSGEYVTSKYIAYNCKALNTTPCNTADNLKRVISSTILPTDEQIEKFDTLIVPTTDFEGNLCFQVSNRSNCADTVLNSCQQCVGIIEYSDKVSACAMCPSGKAVTNFFDYYSTFLLETHTQSDLITLACRKRGSCNSLGNLEKIKNTLIMKFDYDKFSPSTTATASITKSTINLLFIMLTIRLFS